MGYSSLLLDLLIAPALLWRRTRPFAFMVAVLFHLMNVRLFSIGIFPWLMIAVTAIFFSPDWPRRLINLLRPNAFRESHASAGTTPSQRRWYVTVILLSIYLALQCLVPLRHHLYPGNVNWTDEGHRFSWRMKLRDKNGEPEFAVTDTQGNSWMVDPYDYLSKQQVRKMTGRPDMILQFCHYLADEMREEGHGKVEVRAIVMVSLNGRSRQLLVDPLVNLAAQPRTLRPASWILPLEERLPMRKQE